MTSCCRTTRSIRRSGTIHRTATPTCHVIARHTPADRQRTAAHPADGRRLWHAQDVTDADPADTDTADSDAAARAVEPCRDITLGPGEPAAGPWRVESLPAFARALARVAGTPGGRPRLIAVDGRGGGGKTTLAGRLARALRPAAVVHSDDVAWAHSRFGWDDLMIDGVLEPLRAGGPVRYRPPGWERDGRHGHIEVAAGAATVIIEGVGVSREALAPYLDAAIWVQSDYAEAKRRGVRRDMAEEGRNAEEADRNWEEWEAEEVPFLIGDKPWRRARFIVGTASALPHDPETQVVVSDGPAR